MAEEKEQLNQDTIRSDDCQMSEAEIDYDLMESFPASDPPSWTLGIKRRRNLPREYDGEQPSPDTPSHRNENIPSADSEP